MDVAPVKFVNVVPPFVLTCHCTVGVGVPVAAAVNVAFAPAATVALVGLVVIVGAEVRVSVAAFVVTLPFAEFCEDRFKHFAVLPNGCGEFNFLGS